MTKYTFTVFRGSTTGKIVQDRITRPLNPDEVLINITHGSLCGTDEIYLHSSQVLGHEGVGLVKELGSDVSSVKIGDRVGLTYIQKVCNKCKNCTSGWEQYCPHSQPYGRSDPDLGSLGTEVVWNANALVPIPENYGSLDAAAMMCSGATAWTVLSRYGIRPGQRVGVIGVGGMGHLAIKLSAALGYHTVAFSRSDSKKKDCLAFGAKEFYILKQHTPANGSSGSADVVRESMQPIDHLLLCSSAVEDYGTLMPLMATHGTIYPLTVSLDATPVPLLAMLDNGISIQGSLTGSRDSIAKLLGFSAKHGIVPTTECFPLNQSGVQSAFHALTKGGVRYKAVLMT
ncbi:hypothetical protein FE257_010308 [Aspergillus nanangensis]|uniref:Enoyl reductase (ER) domain-containing protein n=1 Tax=Aspergillus nanangensis TaxID=2582783 RepID=A0AAD4CK97_ASPNN|nr:hypothetical protein FE257_010308 [Aspergillus nanangensis]